MERKRIRLFTLRLKGNILISLWRYFLNVRKTNQKGLFERHREGWRKMRMWAEVKKIRAGRWGRVRENNRKNMTAETASWPGLSSKHTSSSSLVTIVNRFPQSVSSSSVGSTSNTFLCEISHKKLHKITNFQLLWNITTHKLHNVLLFKNSKGGAQRKLLKE